MTSAPTLNAIAAAGDRCMKVCDVNLRRLPNVAIGPEIREAIEVADMVKVNDRELALLGGMAALRSGTRKKLIAVTHGAEGSTLYGDGAPISIPGVHSAPGGDNVGCGDAYLAILVLGYILFKNEYSVPGWLTWDQLPAKLDDAQTWLLEQRTEGSNPFFAILDGFRAFCDWLVTALLDVLEWLTWVGTIAASKNSGRSSPARLGSAIANPATSATTVSEQAFAATHSSTRSGPANAACSEPSLRSSSITPPMKKNPSTDGSENTTNVVNGPRKLGPNNCKTST